MSQLNIFARKRNNRTSKIYDLMVIIIHLELRNKQLKQASRLVLKGGVGKTLPELKRQVNI